MANLPVDSTSRISAPLAGRWAPAWVLAFVALWPLPGPAAAGRTRPGRCRENERRGRLRMCAAGPVRDQTRVPVRSAPASGFGRGSAVAPGASATGRPAFISTSESMSSTDASSISTTMRSIFETA